MISPVATKEREYKVIQVNAETGEVNSMKIRKLRPNLSKEKRI